MENDRFRIVLVKPRTIRGVVRLPGYVLLEGVCPEMLTADEIDLSIQLGQVSVEVVKSKEAS
jgi:hypothetical protein